MKHLIFSLICIVCFRTALGSPASALLISPNTKSSDFSSKEVVSQAEVEKDIETLVGALRKGYGGYSQLKTQIESDVIHGLIELSRQSSSTIELCRAIGRTLDKIPDNHLSVRTHGSDERCGKTPARQAQVGPNVQTDNTVPWSYRELKVGVKSVPVISMVRMELATSESWNGFIEKIREIYKSAPALIIDFRGNGGGDDSKAHEMAKMLAGVSEENATLGAAAKLVMSQTPESLALFSNFFLYASLANRFEGKLADAAYEQYYQQYLEKYHQAEAGTLPSEFVIHRKPHLIVASKAFKGPIRILIDAACASSCESGTTFFENHPTAKTVGENTGGYFHFGNVGKLWLKNSNVFVHLPIQAWIFDDGRFIEKSGLVPDIRVQPGQDALGVAVADIERVFQESSFDAR